MKSPQHKPSVEELVSGFGGIADPNHPNMVGLVINDRVLWINAQNSLLMDEYSSKAVIKAEARRRGDIPVVVPPVINNTKLIFNEAPPMDFIPEPIVADSEKIIIPCDQQPTVEFDMGRAADKKVLGEEESEQLEHPRWLDSVVGLATGHRRSAEDDD